MYISVDMGGTTTRVAGSRELGNLQFVSEPLRRRNTHSYEDDLSFIVTSAQRIAGRAAIRAVGIGTPGTPDPQRRRIASAKNIPHWNNRPLVDPIIETLGCSVYYDNDAVTAGLGEAYYGNYRDGDFHYLIWGTGVGGATIERDEHGDVVYASKLLWKQHFGHWDCAGAQLGKDFGKAPEDFGNEEWSYVLRKFGTHLLDYVERFEPPAIVFGGGLAAKHRNHIESYSEQAGIPITVSRFENDSGIIGGFGLIRYEEDPDHRPYLHQEDQED